MNRIKVDEFWDGRAGGGVRCSVTGEEASQYTDPTSQYFEGNGGRSIASLLPGGLRGVVVPRANGLGGSRGFDPHKPRLINIDPDIKGQSCVVDLSRITKESMEAAFYDAAQNPIAQQDIRLLAAQTFHNLAVSYEPVGMGPSRGPRLVERRSPLGDFGSYVVPKASLGGGQVFEDRQEELLTTAEETMSPSVSPRTPMANRLGMNKLAKPKMIRPGQDPSTFQANVGLPAPPMRMTDENGDPINGEYEEQLDDYVIERKEEPPAKKFVDQSEKRLTRPARQVKLSGPAPQAMQVKPVNPAPDVKVVFELEGWGSFDAMYHNVIKNDCVLVLVFDTKFQGGGKYFPPVTDKLLAVKVEGQEENFYVRSYGTKFQHNGFEYCMLVIDPDSEM